MSEPPRAIVFDFGGVVVDWNMRHLFRNCFTTENAMEEFLTEVLTPAENLRCDLGTPLAVVVAELVERHPEHRVPLEAWRDRWIETIPGTIEGAPELVAEVRELGHLVLGLSNFSAETFPWCRDAYPVFELFHDIVISGEAGVAKPDARIYDLLCERNGVTPAEAVFLDDSPANVTGAHDVGMAAFHFTTIARARADLRTLGIRCAP